MWGIFADTRRLEERRCIEMKLLTHNMLACHIKGVKNNFPFAIEVVKTELVDADYNPGELNM